MKPSEVKKYYEGMGYNLKELKEKYGRDLVAEAKKAGFAFKIPKKPLLFLKRLAKNFKNTYGLASLS